MIREKDTRFIVKSLQSARACSIIGLSNMGKSSMLRELCGQQARDAILKERADDYLFVYVDCNLMPERSEQAFHEATLRNLLNALRRAGTRDELLRELVALYQEVVQPGAPIRSPLAFDSAIRKVCEESERSLVLMFDEFDDPFEKLDGRVFLNLRAMKDEFIDTLSFVTATERPLYDIRSDNDSNEFSELFSSREVWLGFVSQNDAREIACEIAAGTELSKDELNFIIDEAGGHAGLIKAVTETWMRLAAGAPEATREQALDLVRNAMATESNVRNECLRIWKQLSDAEQRALISFVNNRNGDKETLESLRTKRLLTASGGVEDVLVGAAWREFVHRQGIARGGAPTGVHVDVEGGDVTVDGRRIDALTDLEYKLLLLLYGKINKIVDKYVIVTNVWGESYLDSVDDARIEKLISRLRSKLEPNVTEPRYLLTLRGRGYKLVSP
jgi:hypothetical protein